MKYLFSSEPRGRRHSGGDSLHLPAVPAPPEFANSEVSIRSADTNLDSDLNPGKVKEKKTDQLKELETQLQNDHLQRRRLEGKRFKNWFSNILITIDD